MARSESRRPTPRQKSPAKAGSSRTSRTAKTSRAPRARSPRSAGGSRAPKAGRPLGSTAPRAGTRPAFLDRAASGPVSGSRPAPGRERRQRHQRAQAMRVVALVAAGLAALALVGLVAFFVLRGSSAFAIAQVEVESTEHVSQEDIQKLVQVPAGSTLLNVDTSALEADLRRNPWVASVSFERAFPSTLRMTITEQDVDMLVVMSSGSLAWYLGDAGVWIEPAKIQTVEGQSLDDVALGMATSEGCLLVTDVPATVDPESGAQATDEVLTAVQAFREGFSADFSAQVVSYAAPSPDSVSCTLKNGVEVLLGSATDISTKEQVVSRYLEKYPDNLLYLNVRVVSNPAVRTVESDNVQAGSGEAATGDAV